MQLIIVGLTVLSVAVVLVIVIAVLETHRAMTRRREFMPLYSSSMGPIPFLEAKPAPRAVKRADPPKPAAEPYARTHSRRLERASERWPVGSLIVTKGEEVKRSSVRVLLGYKPGGECTTAWLEPPPWQKQSVLTERVTQLTKLPPATEPAGGYRKAACLACPVVSACANACADQVAPSVEKQCYMNIHLHPKRGRRVALAG
jgi:hypothetical protein